MRNEIIEGMKQSIYRARYYLLVSLVVGLIVSLKTEFFTGFLVNLVLNTFSLNIGAQETINDAILKVNNSSKKINEIHFNQLVNDTERLAIIASMVSDCLPKSEETIKIHYHLDRMVKENTETINAIKTALNGASR